MAMTAALRRSKEIPPAEMSPRSDISPPAAQLGITSDPPTVKETRPYDMRLSRQRRDAGLVKPRVEFNQLDVSDMLISEGFLAQWDSEDLGKVVEALEEAIRVWSSYD